VIKLGDKPIVCFDVDDTLIMWGKTDHRTGEADTISFTDHAGIKFTTKFHRKHVENIKTHKSRGHYVIVWSAGGGEWAAKAVEILGLEKYVDQCMNKPSWCFDDLQPDKYMPRSRFLEDE